MDPISAIIGVVGGIAPLVANAIGDALASGDRNKALQLAQDAVKRYELNVPPELQDALYQGQAPSEMGNITQDPKLRAMQMRALEGLGKEVDYEGMTPEDALGYAQARQQAGNIDTGMRGAMSAQMAQRGLAGSGMEYANALQGQQSAVNRGSQMSLQTAADARARKLSALNSLGSAAGAMRGQEFGQKSAQASAQDAINRYNTGHAWDVQQYNLNVPKDQYLLNEAHATDINNAEGRVGDIYTNSANRTQQEAAAGGAAVQQLAQAGGSAYANSGKKKVAS